MKKIAAAAVALALVGAAGSAGATNVWSTSFDSNEYENLGPFPWSVLTTVYGGANFTSSQSLPGFGSQYFRNDTTGTTSFTASGLGTHSSLHLSFDLAFIDSWDGDDASNGYGPDILTVKVGDQDPLSLTWTGGGGHGPNFGPGTNVQTGYYAVSSWQDAVVHYDFTFAHSAPNFTLAINASPGFQGGADESWGIDNFSLSASTGAIPEPSSWALMIAGFGLSGAVLRRRRTAVA